MSEEGMLFSWGANRFGQLGYGHNLDKLCPQQVELCEMQVKFDSEPSADLAQAMQEWAQMLLESDESAKAAEAVQQNLENNC